MGVQANTGFALQLNLEQSESGISNPEPLSLIFPTSSLLHLLESESLDVLLLHGVLMVVLCMLVMQITSSEFGNSETKQTFYKKNKFKPNLGQKKKKKKKKKPHLGQKKKKKKKKKS